VLLCVRICSINFGYFAEETNKNAELSMMYNGCFLWYSLWMLELVNAKRELVNGCFAIWLGKMRDLYQTMVNAYYGISF